MEMKVSNDRWKAANKWETEWWGNAVNTLGEEIKQMFVYAPRMGLQQKPLPGNPYNLHTDAGSILDIGGGMVSMLLKTTGFDSAVVLDPIELPQWCIDRYASINALYICQQAEIDWIPSVDFDEVWMYNVLQHTQDPKKVVEVAKNNGRFIRVFEWINTGTNVGHPHSFTSQDLDSLFGGEGRVETLTGEWGCAGDCWYGVFPGGAG